MSEDRSIEERVRRLEQLIVPVDEQRLHVLAHAEVETKVFAIERRLAALEGQPLLEILGEGVEYELTLKVRARVLERSGTAEDLSYELELEARNFFGGRTFAVDADEIVGARRK